MAEMKPFKRDPSAKHPKQILLMVYNIWEKPVILLVNTKLDLALAFRNNLAYLGFFAKSSTPV